MPDIALRIAYPELRARRDAADYDLWLRVASADSLRAYRQPLKIKILPPVVGTLAVTLGELTCAGTGTVQVTGTLTSTLDPMTCSSAGTVRVTGTLAVTLGALTCSGWVSLDRYLRKCTVPDYMRASIVSASSRGVLVDRPEVERDMLVAPYPRDLTVDRYVRDMLVANYSRASIVTD